VVLLKDAKSKVQEKSQEIYGVTPKYKVLKEVGPDHDKKFLVGIFFGKKKLQKGKGKVNKRQNK
jgi:ribonuclease-3